MSVRRNKGESVDLGALDARMESQEQNRRDVWAMKNRLIKHYETYCEHKTIAERGGWIWRLDNAARAKAELIAQASYDSMISIGRIYYTLAHLPAPYVTKDGIPDYVRELYQEWRGNRNPSLNFTQQELLHLSLGEYGGSVSDSIVL